MSDWREQAECKNADPELFFPQPGDTRTAREAISLYCMPCPVRLKCLYRALDRSHQDGIWGGKTEQQREHLKRQMARV